MKTRNENLSSSFVVQIFIMPKGVDNGVPTSLNRHVMMDNVWPQLPHVDTESLIGWPKLFASIHAAIRMVYHHQCGNCFSCGLCDH